MTRKDFALWEGCVTAEKEIVGASLSIYEGQLHWHKTLRRGAWCDSRPELYAGLWVSADVEEKLLGPSNIQVRLPGVAFCTFIRAESGAPLHVLNGYTGFTGEPLLVARVGGSSPMDLWFLFLVREDVRRTRPKAWRVRKHLESGLSAPFDHILTESRRGTMEWSAQWM